MALVDQLLDEVWSGPWAVVLNPTWFEGVPQQYADLVDSWEAAYSLTITATQVRTHVGGGWGNHALAWCPKVAAGSRLPAACSTLA